MPFQAKQGNFFLYSALTTAFVVGFWFWKNYETKDRAVHDALMQALTIILAAAWLLMMAIIAVRCLSKLHLAPEGIAITLFGKTLRRVPTGQIGLLAGFRENTVKTSPMEIAVCLWSLDEFQEWGRCCKYDEPWEGERVIKYIGRIPSVLRSFHLHKNVLLLDWSPERLGLLRQMYPTVQWLDCTERKLFDAQLQNK